MRIFFCKAQFQNKNSLTSDMPGGANYDIIAVGNINKALTTNPNHTYWRTVAKRHTLFAVESVSQPFVDDLRPGEPASGQPDR